MSLVAVPDGLAVEADGAEVGPVTTSIAMTPNLAHAARLRHRRIAPVTTFRLELPLMPIS